MDKRKLLIDTALKLFVENGFHGTATAKIAKEANVANGTLFQYFKTKEELIIAVFITVKSEMAGMFIKSQTEKSITDTLKTQFTNTVVWALKNRVKFQYVQQFYSSPYIHLIKQTELKKYIDPHLNLIKEGIETNKIKDLDAALIYQLFANQTFGVVQYLFSNQKKKQTEVIETTFQLLWDMIKKSK